MIYDTSEEANNRLRDTVVTYEGKPVYVDRVEDHADGILRVLIKAWPYTGSAVRKTINSPAFKRFVTPPLGFMNFFGRGLTHASFAERMPLRQRQQGLSRTTFSASTLVGENVGYDHVYNSDAFREMIEGEYPTFDAVLPRLVPNSSIAVDREFALLRTPEGYVHLFFKRDNVGIVIGGRLYLRPDRRHLIEAIVECPNLPNHVEVLAA